MFDYIFLGILVILALLLSVKAFQTYRATRRIWHLLPIGAYLLAALSILISRAWLASMIWSVIGLLLHFALKKTVK